MKRSPRESLPESTQDTERRSIRRRAERKARSLRLQRAVLPALAVVVVAAVVAVLSSPLVPGLARSGADPQSTTTSTVLSKAPYPASSSTNALLVVQQDGGPAVIVLITGGEKAGVVVGVPGATLLRSSDNFVVLSQTYAPELPDSLSGPMAEAFALSRPVVASVGWGGLRSALAGVPGADKLPDPLDTQGADAGALAMVLAVGLSAGNGGGTGPWWQTAPLGGDAEGFRTSLNAAVSAVGDRGWSGWALPGDMVDYGSGKSYFAPDVQAARALLAGSPGSQSSATGG